MEQRIKQAETRVSKMVFPETTNHHNTMFGGKIILFMTETAFMTAARFSRKNFVVVSCEKVDFHKPIPFSSMIELIGNVETVGYKSLKIKVEVFREKIDQEFRELAVTGYFTLVAVDADANTIPVI